MQLTMVSIWYRGKRFTIFVKLPVIDGRVQYDVGKLAQEVGVKPGDCFAYGV